MLSITNYTIFSAPTALKGLATNKKLHYCHVCQIEHSMEVSQHETTKVHKNSLEKFKKFFQISNGQVKCRICLIDVGSYAAAHSHANQHFVTWIDMETITEFMFSNFIGFENKNSDHYFCFACNCVVTNNFHNFADVFDHVQRNNFHVILKGRSIKIPFRTKYSKTYSTRIDLVNMIRLREY